MSKIAKYLNGHILGEVSARDSRLKQFSQDKSVLSVAPSLVVFPRITDDIRKIMRFSWQLAEKGHIFGITARGYGGSTDGSSLGEGVVLDLSRHMNGIYELDLKNKMVRVAAGVNFRELNLALGSQALNILQSPAGERLTVGGAVAQNLPAEKYNYGELADAVEKMEVVLSNGEIVQTGRISKRELNRKKGLQNFEGELYRKIDGLIEDHFEAISSKIQEDASYGYSGITKVKQADGSFDLTPLFFGSEGTLGVITELVLKADFIVDETDFMVASFQDRDDARDFIDKISKYKLNVVEMYDGKLFESAVAAGKKYDFYIERLERKLKTKMILVLGVTDKTARKRLSVAKKIARAAEKFSGPTIWAPDGSLESDIEIDAIRDVREVLRSRGGINKEEISPLQGVYVPLERFEEFYLQLQKLALKYAIPAPIQGSALTSVFEIMAEFDFTKVTDRQKTMRFIEDIAKLLASIGGEFAYGAGEGRIFGQYTKINIDQEVLVVYKQIKDIFDPQQILNPGVKAENAAKDLLKIIKNGR